MTWAEFKAAVLSFMPAYARKVGLSTYLLNQTMAGVLTLQEHIPAYRTGRVSTMAGSSFTAYGYGAQASLPIGSQITALLSVTTDECSPMKQLTEESLLDIERGELSQEDHVFVWNPATGVLVVSPSPITDGSSVAIVYDTGNVDYADGDGVSLDFHAASVVSEFVQARTARDIERDLNMANAHDVAYRKALRTLIAKFNTALSMASRNRAPLSGAAIPPTISTPVVIVAVPPLLGFDSPGAVGQIALDGDYIYTYTAENGWAKSLRTF